MGLYEVYCKLNYCYLYVDDFKNKKFCIFNVLFDVLSL